MTQGRIDLEFRIGAEVPLVRTIEIRAVPSLSTTRYLLAGIDNLGYRATGFDTDDSVRAAGESESNSQVSPRLW